VTINPSTIDTEHLHNPSRYEAPVPHSPVVIGWTGTHSTLKYLEVLTPSLKGIESDFRFVVIADKRPDLRWPAVAFKAWSKDSEIADLLQFDIGVMPLTDDLWARGKCGFKALQYMALGIPVVASPVGVNAEIIEHGVNGFLCTTNDEWTACLNRLIMEPALRHQMGTAGRRTVVERYSVVSNSTRFLSLFR
jgi:glycosyltransferase involved in cell wall biosynthesis